MFEDDFRPVAKRHHEVGQDLSMLSVEELHDRITLLKEEIVRLEADISAKQASKSAAQSFFKL